MNDLPWFKRWYAPWYSPWQMTLNSGTETPPDPCPAVVSEPSTTGTFANGSTITAISGVYTNYTIIENQWYKNDVLQPETGLTYDVAGFVPGDELLFAQSVGGVDCMAAFPVLPPYIAEAPENVSLPLILIPGDGSPLNGETLTRTLGSWVTNGGTPTTLWYRDGIPTAITASTYVLGDLDHDTDITVEVTYTNTFAATPATSLAINIYYAVSNTTAPVIAGWTDGTPLRITTAATWKFANSNTVQWFKNGSAVVGQTSTLYTGTIANGDIFFVRTTGTNTLGTVTVDSNSITTDENIGFTDTSAMNYDVIGYCGDTISLALSENDAMRYTVAGHCGDTAFETIAENGAMNYSVTGSYV
jgi:hypothetical protein